MNRNRFVCAANFERQAETKMKEELKMTGKQFRRWEKEQRRINSKRSTQ